MIKLLILLIICNSCLNAGWKWSATKKVGKVGIIYGAKKGIDTYTKYQKKKLFKKSKVNGRTVYQRKIDLDKVIKRKNIRTGEEIVETNAERLKKGMPPYIRKNGRDEPIELHHSRQNDKGSLFELSKSTHRIKNKKKGANALHPYGHKKHPHNPVSKDRTKNFDKERELYYKQRIKDLLGR